MASKAWSTSARSSPTAASTTPVRCLCAPARSSRRRSSPSTQKSARSSSSMKQLIPTDIDEYIAEHKVGDNVSGRVVEVSGTQARRRIGRRHPRHLQRRQSRSAAAAEAKPEAPARGKARSLQPVVDAEGPLERQRPCRLSRARTIGEGQIRRFKITKLDAECKEDRSGVGVASFTDTPHR